MRVLIVGAGGTLGLPLVRRLHAAGEEVYGLTRSARSAEQVQAAGARVLVANALDREGLVRQARDVKPEVLVHLLTALPKHGPTRASHLEATNRLRTEGTSNLLAASHAAGVRRLVAESVVFAYGFANFGEQMLDEKTVPAAKAPSKGMKAAQAAVLSLEQQVLDASAAGRLEGIALRFGTLYGPDVPSSEFMLKMLRRRMMALPGGGHSVLPWIEISDALTAIECAVASTTAGEVYNVVDDEPVPVRDFVGELARVFETPKPYRVPYWLGRSLMPFGAHFLDRTVLRASNQKIKTALGWLPEYPTYRDGLRHWAEALGTPRGTPRGADTTPRR